MKPLPQSLVDEIKALQYQDARKLKVNYAEMLSDVPECNSSSLLRSIIAYRLQEKHYGISLSPECLAWMESDESSVSPKEKGRRVGSSARLIRVWKGVRHEVVVREDGFYEHEGVAYKSLSAVARAITGTNWNGKLFFGVK